MTRLTIARAALDDIESLLAWTHENLGEVARSRYEALIEQAIIDVFADPQRTGCNARPEVGPQVMTYHLWHSKRRVARSVGRVQRPRHFLVLRCHEDGLIEIGRLLHDSMDLFRHLPKDYQS